MSAADAPIVLRGTVIHGDKRGRELGFPTANVALTPATAPAYGVYAATLDGRPAAVSVGVRPTFGTGLEPLLEAHVLDFSGDLYGREVEVVLVERIRDELAFSSVAELCERIAADVRAVRDISAYRPLPSV